MIKAVTAAAKKPAPKKPAAKRPTKAELSTAKYVLGDKPYNPKASHNIAAWNRVQKALAKGPADHTAIRKALSYTDTEMKNKELGLKQQNHYDFIGYMLRGEHLRITK